MEGRGVVDINDGGEVRVDVAEVSDGGVDLPVGGEGTGDCTENGRNWVVV